MDMEIFHNNINNLEEQRITFITFDALSLFDRENEIEASIFNKLNQYSLRRYNYMVKVQVEPIEDIKSTDNLYFYFRINNFYVLVDLN